MIGLWCGRRCRKYNIPPGEYAVLPSRGESDADSSLEGGACTQAEDVNLVEIVLFYGSGVVAKLVNAAVCKTAMRRFKSGLHLHGDI